MKKVSLYIGLTLLFFSACQTPVEDTSLEKENRPFLWESASIYFLLTDRFNNGDPSNDLNFERNDSTAILRGMMGGDLKGITQKIEEGYFNKLGINALWFTPVLEQNKGIVEEGTGPTYPYHGYWIQDWTALDPNFGTHEDLSDLIETAHQNDIRVLMDVVINHTGPVTKEDPQWPDEWVRTSPKCQFTGYETTVSCTLVENLPDIKTEQDEAVALPALLTNKWKKEGRYEEEMKSLDAFFARTNYPRAPRFYIMKWLTDYVRKYGIDGYRVDTAKHTEESVWKELRKEADIAFADWKKANPDKVLDDNEFYMVGEVYNYNVATDTLFDIGDRNVNYFANGLSSLINFGFKHDARHALDSTYSSYSAKLSGPFKNKSFVNYISSHDDGEPFDRQRAQPFSAGTKLLLCPGGAQIYYGDELGRSLVVEGANGDANLRSFMNWKSIQESDNTGNNTATEVLDHWQKIGSFRNEHPAVGAGIHKKMSEAPYYFSRSLTKGTYKDAVIVGMGLQKGPKSIEVNNVFEEGKTVKEYYSGETTTVKEGKLSVDTPFDLVLYGLE